MADLWCRRHPQDPEKARERALKVITGAGPDELTLVADDGGVLVAYGRAFRWTRPSDALPEVCPSGWYLLGVSVREDRKRRGIGRALTRLRIEWLSERGAGTIYYFADFDNEASVRLHEEFGFRPVRRGVTFPGMSDDSIELVLHRLELNGPASDQGRPGAPEGQPPGSGSS